MQALDILKKYWGYNTFRLKQEEVINSVLKSKDTLALLPTAGGKSICFQVPALMKDGICLVISPLISLMEDQIKYLKSKGIKSVSISSSMNSNDIQTALTNCLYGGIKFLYLSPEKLRDQSVKEKIDQLNVNLIAVDEAHCISDWGHNFRPSYRLISEIRDTKKNIPILALTATANKSVVDDIQNNLNFKEKNLIKSTFLRENLSYVAVDCNSKKKTLLNLLNKFKSSVIIYVSSRKESNEIALFLKNNNISSTSYHAGIAFKKRIKIQEEWTNNLIRVIVATNAFGLGINKEDIRLIIHMQIPMNMESYYQEAGRAGRDGKTAYSFILYDRLDFRKNIQNLNIWHPEIKSIQNIYQKICDYLQIGIHELPDEDFQFNISSFCNRYNLDIKQTFIIINFLEKEELI
ncbi:RecQ family ATP-dependent DNA helicase, partial [bacterium]|nr:RecQ family ATP-dependent DNA helicase [bacterium]